MKAKVVLLLVGLGVFVFGWSAAPAFAAWGSGGYHGVYEHTIWQGRMTPEGALARDIVASFAPAFADVIRGRFGTGQQFETLHTPYGVVSTRRDSAYPSYYPPYSPAAAPTSIPDDHFGRYGEGVRKGLDLKGKPIPPAVAVMLQQDPSFAKGFWDTY